jgi:hypothetical protein
LHSNSVFLLLLTNTRSEHWRWSFHGFLNLNFFTLSSLWLIVYIASRKPSEQ